MSYLFKVKLKDVGAGCNFESYIHKYDVLDMNVDAVNSIVEWETEKEPFMNASEVQSLNDDKNVISYECIEKEEK